MLGKCLKMICVGCIAKKLFSPKWLLLLPLMFFFNPFRRR